MHRQQKLAEDFVSMMVITLYKDGSLLSCFPNMRSRLQAIQ